VLPADCRLRRCENQIVACARAPMRPFVRRTLQAIRSPHMMAGAEVQRPTPAGSPPQSRHRLCHLNLAPAMAVPGALLARRHPASVNEDRGGLLVATSLHATGALVAISLGETGAALYREWRGNCAAKPRQRSQVVRHVGGADNIYPALDRRPDRGACRNGMRSASRSPQAALACTRPGAQPKPARRRQTIDRLHARNLAIKILPHY